MSTRHAPGRAGQPLSGLAALAAVVLVGVAGSTPGRSAPSPFPELVQPPSQERHVGKIVFAELVTPDIATAKLFYGKVFDWKFNDVQFGRGRFAQATRNGAPVAELAQRPPPPGLPQRFAWLTFIAVGNVDVEAAMVVKGGGKILYPPHAITSFGREAVLQDPQGAVFAIVDSSSGDPPDTLAKTGTWIWSSLTTSNPDLGAAFYQDVFGYDVFEVPEAPKGQHFLLASGNYARASVNALPSSRPDVHPRWIDYVRVDDVEAVAAMVQALGGQVLVPPHMDRHGGKLSIVADPMGAAFGLMEWHEDAAGPAADAGETK